MNSFKHVSRWTTLGLAAALVCAPAIKARAQDEGIKNQSNEMVSEGTGAPDGDQAPVDATSIVAKAKASGLQAAKAGGAQTEEKTVPAPEASKDEWWVHKANAATDACGTKYTNDAVKAGAIFGSIGTSVGLGIYSAVTVDGIVAAGVIGGGVAGFLAGPVVAVVAVAASCSVYHYGQEAKKHYFGGN